MPNYSFRLYITGYSARAHLAISNLRRIVEEHLPGQYELEVIDVLEQPELAEKERIIATPTLIKSLPLPSQRIIGDLSDIKRVVDALGLHHKE